MEIIPESNRLEKAKELLDEIRRLDYFIGQVCQETTEPTGFKWSPKLLFKKLVTVKYSIFGKRFFGAGSHQKEIQIPESLTQDIRKLAKERKAQLEMEYAALMRN